MKSNLASLPPFPHLQRWYIYHSLDQCLTTFTTLICTLYTIKAGSVISPLFISHWSVHIYWTDMVVITEIESVANQLN